MYQGNSVDNAFSTLRESKFFGYHRIWELQLYLCALHHMPNCHEVHADLRYGIAQRAINHFTLDEKRRVKMFLPESFDVNQLLDLLKSRRSSFNIRARQASGSLYVLDLGKCYDFLDNIRETSSISNGDFRSFIDETLVKTESWHSCVRECDPNKKETVSFPHNVLFSTLTTQAPLIQMEQHAKPRKLLSDPSLEKSNGTTTRPREPLRHSRNHNRGPIIAHNLPQAGNRRLPSPPNGNKHTLHKRDFHIPQILCRKTGQDPTLPSLAHVLVETPRRWLQQR